MELASDRARLEEIDNIRSTLPPSDTSHSRLQHERRAIRSRLLDYTYPILTLPNELVVEIIKQTMPEWPDMPALIGPEAGMATLLDSPTTLLGICRLWRTLALQTPVLWSRIEVDGRDQDLEIARTWLQRSATQPLSLSFDCENVKADSGGEISQKMVLDLLCVHRSRWEYVKFYVYGSRALKALSGDAPLLVDAHISADRLGYERTPIRLRDAPLRTLYLWGEAYDLESVSWKQLTCLMLFCTEFEYCAPVLREATGLLHCKLLLRDITAEAIHITLPRLQTLVIQTDDDIDGEVDCLGHFTLPAVRRLELDRVFLEFPGPGPGPTISAFVARSQCRLERLQITEFGRMGDETSASLAECVDATQRELLAVNVSVHGYAMNRQHDYKWWLKDVYWGGEEDD
ncbi:F-box domain-containing protein [Mycena kentingensis (nom. inval.)]|nr:F-box domain-containing protein [Mycena kentingensis (nom. inval.)]